MARIKVADLIVKQLTGRHGVRHVFMICGGGAMHLNDAVGRSEGLTIIANHHEQAAAIGAEGYARTSRGLGVVIVTSGPGGLNTLTGVMGQWTDSVPVLYISGQIKRETAMFSYPQIKLRQLGDQEAPITDIVRPITKFTAIIDDPLQTLVLLEQAIYLAHAGRPGPVWLDVPLDVQSAIVEEDDLAHFSPPPAAIYDLKIGEVMRLLTTAKRPMIIAGHGIKIAQAKQEFAELASALKIPVVTSFGGLDVLPTDHPCFVGRIGTTGSRAGNFVLQNADLILAIGSRNNIRQVSYEWRHFGRSGKKIVVDIDAAELEKPTLIPDLPIRADAGQFIHGLRTALKEQSLPDFTAWLAWGIERKERYPVVLAEYWQLKETIHPYCFIDAITAALAEGSTFVGGNGTAFIGTYQAARVKKNQNIFYNAGCATMGYDLPAAIGASFALGKGPLVCLTGDGSIMMNLQELATIAHHQLPIKIFVINNNGYVSMRQTQESYFGGRIVASDPNSGVGFPSITKVAEAFGLRAFSINTYAAMHETIKELLAVQGPVLCEIIAPTDYVFSPKLASAVRADGRLVSKPLEDASPLLPRDEFLDNMLVEPIGE